MRQMRSLIGGVTLSAPEFGLELVPGRVVDLDDRLPHGGTLADLVKVEWFEPVAEPRARRRGATPDSTESPVSPAAEEEHHG